MREIVHIQAGQCGNQIGAKVRLFDFSVKLCEKNMESDFFSMSMEWTNEKSYVVAFLCN